MLWAGVWTKDGPDEKHAQHLAMTNQPALLISPTKIASVAFSLDFAMLPTGCAIATVAHLRRRVVLDVQIKI